MSKAKFLKGKARVSSQYNQPWHGFTLQRGHFYGETLTGVYFVSGLETRPDGKIKVYLCKPTMYCDNYNWKAYWCDPKAAIIATILEAMPRRAAMGIDCVEFQPLERQKIDYKPRLTSEKPYPYDPVRIPAPGKGQIRYSVSSEAAPASIAYWRAKSAARAL